MSNLKHSLTIVCLLAMAAVLGTSPAVAQDLFEIGYGEAACEASLNDSSGDAWTFEGKAGDVVTIALFSEEFDAFLALRDPSGRILVSDDDSGGGLNALINSFELDVDGTYKIVVRDAFESSQGNFTLMLGVNSSEPLPPTIPELDFNNKSFVDVESGRSQEWLLEIEESDELVVAMLSDMRSDNPVLDPYLEISFQLGSSILASDDDSGGGRNALAQFEADEDGLLSILATSYSRNIDGDYILLVGRCLQ